MGQTVFRQKMERKGKKVALIVDNCPAYPNLKGLKSVELVFLPPNTTSKTQPMDQGVIQSLKCHYRKRVLYYALIAIDSGLTVNRPVIVRILFLPTFSMITNGH